VEDDSLRAIDLEDVLAVTVEGCDAIAGGEINAGAAEERLVAVDVGLYDDLFAIGEDADLARLEEAVAEGGDREDRGKYGEVAAPPGVKEERMLPC
jgi:hypothetical protein